MRSLHEETLALVKEERRLAGLVIQNLQKISDSKIYLELGYSSLFQYCTQALGYSEASAYRRLEAVKVMRSVPDVKEKLNSGALNLSTIAIAQSFFKASRATVEEKKIALEKIEGCSKRETENVLADLFEMERPNDPPEKIRYFRSEEASLQIVVPQELLQKLDRIKSLRSHKNPNMSYAEVIADMCDVVLKKIDPMEKAQKFYSEDSAPQSNNIGIAASSPRASGGSKPAHEPSRRRDPPANCKRPSSANRRYIPAKIKSDVWQRDQGQCTFVETQSGRRCSSKHLLQLDHDMPLFLGGETSRKNLRLLCHAHHRLRDREFGIT